MMKLTKFVLLLLFVGISFNGQAQSENKLRLQSNFFSNKFFKGDTIISVNQVLYEMAPNESVYTLMKSAKTDFVFAQILGATGGVLIGWPLGTAIVGGSPNWALVGIGAGVLAISIPISLNFRKKANLAISEHNSLITASNNSRYRPAYALGFTGNGLIFSLRF